MAIETAFAFLDDLRNNNHTEWFRAEKKRYEDYKKEYLALIESVLVPLQAFDETLLGLEPKNCTFRINRDIRFSKDKSPYKTNMGMWFTQNKQRKNSPGYYVHYDKEQCFLAGGIWCPEPADVAKIRREIAFFHDELEAIAAAPEFKNTFVDFTREAGMVLKKAPKGFEPDHPAIEWLKLKSFTVSMPWTVAQFKAPDAGQQIAEKLRIMKPLNDFLSRALDTEA